MRILLVEDSKPVRRENERALLAAGYEVICAVEGEAALRFAKDEQPDLILLDLLLPRMSGFEVLAHLKGDPATADIPVVILSSLSDRNRPKLMAAGAEDYIEKSKLMPTRKINLLPKMLEDIIARINRKRGTPFSTIPMSK